MAIGHGVGKHSQFLLSWAAFHWCPPMTMACPWAGRVFAAEGSLGRMSSVVSAQEAQVVWFARQNERPPWSPESEIVFPSVRSSLVWCWGGGALRGSVWKSRETTTLCKTNRVHTSVCIEVGTFAHFGIKFSHCIRKAGHDLL